MRSIQSLRSLWALGNIAAKLEELVLAPRPRGPYKHGGKMRDWERWKRGVKILLTVGLGGFIGVAVSMLLAGAAIFAGELIFGQAANEYWRDVTAFFAIAFVPFFVAMMEDAANQTKDEYSN